MDRPPHTASRRRFLAGLSAGSAGLLPVGAPSTARADTPDGMDEGVCVLTPQSIEGPFYSDPKLVRADIADGRDGVPLRLRLRVVDAGPCTPLPGARVDVWHCDARGLYSGYPGQGDGGSIDTTGQTFLRGTQITDEQGHVTFRTIYPGWYAGRATHIHVKAFIEDRIMLTGQIYFPDALNEFIYTNVPAYGDRKADRFVINANDGIAAGEDPQRRAFCAVKEERDCYLATLTLGVDRQANGRREAPGRPPFGAGPPPPPSGLGQHAPSTRKDRVLALVPGLRTRPSR